jgi:hypothetical protein
MAAYIIAALVLGYTMFILIKKGRDLKAGKSCCSGCSSCPARGKCAGKED